MKKSILLSLILSSIVVANNNLSSQQLLSESLKRINSNPFNSEEQVNTISNWLTGLPTVQASILQSENHLGADEYELSLNLPFKSRARKQLDKRLLETSMSLKNIMENKKKLFVSGLIRETIWNYRIAIKKRTIEQTKLDWLKKQQVLLINLVSSGGSNIDLLLVDKQILEAQLLILALDKEANIRLKQFYKITGEETIPAHFYENGIMDEKDVVINHPTVQQIQLILRQSSIIYKLAGKANNTINLSLTTVNTKAIGLNDRQYGIALELPIGSNKSTTQTASSTLLQEQSDLSSKLIIFEQEFSLQFSELKEEHHYLTKKQALLEQTSVKTKQIFAKLEQLRNNNEFNQFLFYQRMGELISSIYQTELNQIYINQNQSRQKQLAGVSL